MMRNVGALAQPLLLCLKWRVGSIEAHVEEEGTLPLRLSMFLHPCQGLLRKSCSKKGGTNQLLDLGSVDMKLRCHVLQACPLVLAIWQNRVPLRRSGIVKLNLSLNPVGPPFPIVACRSSAK